MGQRVRDLEALVAAGQALCHLRPDGLAQVLHQIAVLAAEVLEADQSLVLVRRHERRCWKVEAAAGKSQDWGNPAAVLAEECPLALRALETGAAVMGQLMARVPAGPDQAQGIPTGTALAIPMAAEHGKPFGVFLLVRESEAIPAWNGLLAQGLAAIAALAITDAHKQFRLSHFEHLGESLAHDLKAPGERIRDLAAVVSKEYGGQLDDRGKRWLQLLEFNGDDLVRRVNGLLDLAGVGATQQPMEDVDPGSVLREVLERWADDVRSRRAHVHVGNEFRLVACHPSALRQIFDNLISNAIKFSGDRPDFQIRVTSETQHGELCVVVADNGIGIPVQQHARVFEPFVRLNPGGVVGSGIGLSIVKRLVEIYGGRAWIESNEEGGCTVRFTLPLAGGRVEEATGFYEEDSPAAGG